MLVHLFTQLWDIRNFSCIQTFNADDTSDALRAFSCVPDRRRIVSAGKRVHIISSTPRPAPLLLTHACTWLQLHMFDYTKQENPDLTDDTTAVAALYNPVSTTLATAAGREVKVPCASKQRL